jgi:hypothetical protein
MVAIFINLLLSAQVPYPQVLDVQGYIMLATHTWPVLQFQSQNQDEM